MLSGKPEKQWNSAAQTNADAQAAAQRKVISGEGGKSPRAGGAAVSERRHISVLGISVSPLNSPFGLS